LGLATEAKVENVEIAGNHYTVQAGPRTNLWRNGQHLFEASGPAIVRKFEWSNQRIKFHVKTPASFRDELIRLKSLDNRVSTARLRVDRGALRDIAVQQGGITFDVPAGEHSISIVLKLPVGQ
jgi:hypothetical protein